MGRHKLLRDVFGVYFSLLGIFLGYVRKLNLHGSGSDFPKIINKTDLKQSNSNTQRCVDLKDDQNHILGG